MVVVPFLDIIQAGFNSQVSTEGRQILNILYNNNVSICFTKNYIDLLEKAVLNKDLFEALIVELHDSDRINIQTTTAKQTINDEFIEIAQNARVPFLMPLSKQDNFNNTLKIPFLTIFDHCSHLNRNWVCTQLLSKNFCNVSYQDFHNEAEIIAFFKTIFSIPKYIRQISIFDREQNINYLSSIKGLNINYYTILPKGPNNEHLRKEVKKDLKKGLGGKVKLFFTTNPRIIHERKIIFEDILVTLDNSLANLTSNEPTWEIFITYHKLKASKWQEKRDKFSEVRD